MGHPIDVAMDLVERYAAVCEDRQTALDALARLRVYATGDERACADCGETFYLTEPQREFFLSRGLAEPVRCNPCRDARRAALAERGLR
jgi:hypothetical protein